jgi:hypothetical protein
MFDLSEMMKFLNNLPKPPLVLPALKVAQQGKPKKMLGTGFLSHHFPERFRQNLSEIPQIS